MKITIIKKVSEDKIGYIHKNGVKLEPCEEDTFNYLTLFGFDIEIIKPTHIEKINNPDVKRHTSKVEKQIIDLFSEDGSVRRMMIIRKDGEILDLTK